MACCAAMGDGREVFGDLPRGRFARNAEVPASKHGGRPPGAPQPLQFTQVSLRTCSEIPLCLPQSLERHPKTPCKQWLVISMQRYGRI
jgi:hypothetical protein